MKLRFRENSIRMRLTRPEVEAIGRGNSVRESIGFPDGRVFTYQLETDSANDLISAHLEACNLIVRVGQHAATCWSTSEEVGLERSVPLTNGGHLRILIEKDFECLHSHDGERVAGAYPNPRAGRA
ncbi:MAG: hypothetical protein AB7Q91_05945 [Phycisphaerales bacterium]